jgi:uncharacterized membrane protein
VSMTNHATPRIWHVGNWCIQLGQTYIESPFKSEKKDVEMLNYAQPFVDALRAIPSAEIISQPSWELYHLSPEAFEERLRWATAIVFADVETKCLMLHPDFFQRAKWGDSPVTFPDRFDILRDWIARGGHFHMNGGWYSFGGELGKGGWGRSRIHDMFPVVCLQGDDLIESTAGYEVRCNDAKNPMVTGLDWSSLPALLGFNESRLRDGCDAVVEIQNQGTWHPLLASRKFGTGRVTCWMTGASPHWGINFMKWKQYQQFWKQVFAG